MYGTAQLKLDTRFWLLVSVSRFCSSLWSIIACYLQVTLVVSRIWLVSGRNWLLRESPYKPPYESHRRKISTRLDSWNMHDFPIKSFLVYEYKNKLMIAKWLGCMSNECQRVITLSLYISFQNHNTQVKLSTNLQYQMKNSSISNRIDWEAIKVPSSLTL